MVLCFLVASTFWVLNSLNKTYQNIRISYPVKFVYNPKKLVPVTAPPKEVTINVSGKGWKLLRRQLNLRIRPARIEVPVRYRKSYMTSRELRPALNAALNGLVLNYVVTDTLYFDFQPLVHRTLRLVPDSSQSLTAPQFTLAAPLQLRPEEVKVFGPASLVYSLPDPYPVHLKDSNLTRNYSALVPLSFASHSLIKANVREVNASFKVKPLQEGQALVAIRLRHSNKFDKHPVKTEPFTTQIKYYFQPDSDSIDPSDIFVEADLSRFSARDSTAPLVVGKKPAQVKTVVFSPKKVKILFRKN